MKIYVASSWRNTYQPDIVQKRGGMGRDEQGFSTGTLVPSDYGMWISSVSVFRLQRELTRRATEAERRVKELEVTLEFCGEILGWDAGFRRTACDPPPHAAVDAILTQIDRAESAEAKVAEIQEQLDAQWISVNQGMPAPSERVDMLVDDDKGCRNE